MQRGILRELLTIFCVIGILIVIVFKMDDGCNITLFSDKPVEQQDSTSKAKPTAGGAYSEGRELFKMNCASCHNPASDGTGPVLKGAVARWEAAGEYKGKTGKQWLYAWVKNYSEPVKEGYPYAIEMANSRISNMNTFPALTDEQIDKIFLYVEEYKKQ